MTTPRTVLLVEDQDDVRALVRLVLERDGFRVLEAGSLGDAVGQFIAAGAHVDLLAADVALPDGTGPDLHRRLSARQPRLPALFMSGDPDDGVLAAAAPGSDASFIQKPFTLAAFAGRVRQLAEASCAACATPVAHVPPAARARVSPAQNTHDLSTLTWQRRCVSSGAEMKDS